MRAPNLHAPHFHLPRFRRHARADVAPAHRHPLFLRLEGFENVIDVAVIALIVLLAAAMVYGLLTATDHPAYFDRLTG
ncbi:hypothetical protein [Phenylobacterium hankyongense]|uniref:hypothetical protein n=1 Tax=Phenylobacterium hankyongense TaxID=1813876 RepID=UPI001057626C|nr:hypothetical protein [Phenylobacterium hankyongense]